MIRPWLGSAYIIACSLVSGVGGVLLFGPMTTPIAFLGGAVSGILIGISWLFIESKIKRAS